MLGYPVAVRQLAEALDAGSLINLVECLPESSRLEAEVILNERLTSRDGHCWECNVPVESRIPSPESTSPPEETISDTDSDYPAELDLDEILGRKSTSQPKNLGPPAVDAFNEKIAELDALMTPPRKSADSAVLCSPCCVRLCLLSDLCASDFVLLGRMWHDWPVLDALVATEGVSQIFRNVVCPDGRPVQPKQMPNVFVHGGRAVDIQAFAKASTEYKARLERVTVATRENLEAIVDVALGMGFWTNYASSCFPPKTIVSDPALHILNRCIAKRILSPVSALEGKVPSGSALKLILLAILNPLADLQAVTRHPQFLSWHNFLEKFIWDYGVKPERRDELEENYVQIVIGIIYDNERPRLFYPDAEGSKARIVAALREYSARGLPQVPEKFWVAASTLRVLDRLKKRQRIQ